MQPTQKRGQSKKYLFVCATRPCARLIREPSDGIPKTPCNKLTNHSATQKI